METESKHTVQKSACNVDPSKIDTFTLETSSLDLADENDGICTTVSYHGIKVNKKEDSYVIEPSKIVVQERFW